MKCLENYRRNLVHELNTEFRSILISPDVDPVHDFRVGMKRMTAFYYFLQAVDPGIKAKKILKKYRKLFKSLGRIRDLHIAIDLLIMLDTDRKSIGKLRRACTVYYKRFLSKVERSGIRNIRLPSVGSFKLSERKIMSTRTIYLNDLITRVIHEDTRMTQTAWHQRRILLKRYHHTLDAFQRCPGTDSYESELKQIRMLETLLGDWHDAVVTAEIVSKYTLIGEDDLIKMLHQREKRLLDAAKIYKKKFSRKVNSEVTR